MYNYILMKYMTDMKQMKHARAIFLVVMEICLDVRGNNEGKILCPL